MIVALEYMWYQHTGSIMMREVNTEEEAFAEMRHFLRVNNIPSNMTGVYIVEEHEYVGRIVAKHKEVRMCQRGCQSPNGKGFPDPCFGIYYGTDKPRYVKLKSLEEYGLTVKKDYFGNVVMDGNNYPMLVNDYYNDGNKWYTPLLMYLQDLEERKAGGE